MGFKKNKSPPPKKKKNDDSDVSDAAPGRKGEEEKGNSLSLFHSLSLCLSVSVSGFPSIPLYFSPFVRTSLCVSLPLSFSVSLAVTLSLSLSLSLSVCVCVIFSFCVFSFFHSFIFFFLLSFRELWKTFGEISPHDRKNGWLALASSHARFRPIFPIISPFTAPVRLRESIVSQILSFRVRNLLHELAQTCTKMHELARIFPLDFGRPQKRPSHSKIDPFQIQKNLVARTCMNLQKTAAQTPQRFLPISAEIGSKS